MTHLEPPAAPAAGWYADPEDAHALRFWNGTSWTEHRAQATQPWAPPVVETGQKSRDPRYYRPARTVGMVTWVLCAVIAALAVILALVAPDAVEEYRRADAAGVDYYDVFTPFDAVGFLLMLAMLGAWISSCLWLWRVRENAEALRPYAQHRRARGWVWGGWLVPVANLWFPYQLVRDVRGATSPTGGAGATVRWWWASFLSWYLTWSFAANGIGDLDVIGAVPAVARVSAMSAVVALVLWIGVVRQVQADQERAAAEVGRLVSPR